MKKRLFLGAVVLSLVAVFGITRAALLNVNLRPSVILYVTGGATSTQYNPVSQIFSVVATPSQIQFSPTEGAVPVAPPRSMTIRIQVDNTGALVGGVAGPDLVISGRVTRVVGTTTNVYSGLLLTGEVQPNGFGFLDSGGTVDNYDFRFTPTGGQLLEFYQCDHIAVTLSSAGSTFVGSFTTNFSGQAKGNVGLEDLIPPVVTCPNDIIVECNAGSGGQRGAFVSFPDPVGKDNCDTNITFVYTPPSGSFFVLNPGLPAYTNYVVTLTAADAWGNQSTCAFNVTVQDTLPPAFNDNSSPVIGECGEDPFVLTNDTGRCYATFTFTKPTATNLCCVAAHTIDVSAIDEYGAVISLTNNGDGTVTGYFPVTCVGTNKLTVVAWDDHGNSAEHVCGVLVVDNEPPVITCDSNQIVECTGGPVFYQEPSVYDNCPNVTVSCTPTNGSVLGIGTHSILCIAADCSGNTNQCAFDVIVQDTTPPRVTCASNITVECGSTWSFTTPTASDACCGTNVTIAIVSTVTNGTCPWVITRTWKATDCCTNSASCSQTVTVVDTTPPTITCAPNKTVTAGWPWS
ncbi:MAG: HYR domain-containing protein, partial [Verrucomicrobiia bacterium]